MPRININNLDTDLLIDNSLSLSGKFASARTKNTIGKFKDGKETIAKNFSKVQGWSKPKR